MPDYVWICGLFLGSVFVCCQVYSVSTAKKIGKITMRVMELQEREMRDASNF